MKKKILPTFFYPEEDFGCPEAIDLLGQPCRGWMVRKAVGKCWGNLSGRG